MKRKIAYITGSRADYGIIKTVLKAIKLEKNLELEIIATGMHLMNEFGMTVNDIIGDGYQVHNLEVTYRNDSRESMALFIGDLIKELTYKIEEIHPDIILLLGDRGEMLAGAIVGVYLGIPVAHIHGGEVTETVDEYARHAITKLSNIHFPATEESRKRIIKMGENPSNVFVSGAPGLDEVLSGPFFGSEELSKKYGLDISKPLIILALHPVSENIDGAPIQMRHTLEAIKELGYPTIVIYPNSDAGGREMIKVIKEFENIPYIKTFKNIQRKEFLSLLKISTVIVGNSSSGIIEAPSFGIPTVNIGNRQAGRERGNSIIDVDYDKAKIMEKIKKSIEDQNFRESIKTADNLYGDGKSGEKIAKILATINLNEKILRKKLSY